MSGSSSWKCHRSRQIARVRSATRWTGPRRAPGRRHFTEPATTRVSDPLTIGRSEQSAWRPPNGQGRRVDSVERPHHELMTGAIDDPVPLRCDDEVSIDHAGREGGRAVSRERQTREAREPRARTASTLERGCTYMYAVS